MQTSRANLKVIPTKERTFDELMRDAVQLASGLKEAESFERVRLNASAFLARALEIAGRDRAEIEVIEKRLRAMQPSEALRPALVFVEAIYRHAIDPNGYAAPPQLHELPTPHVLRMPMETVAVACMDLGVSRLELAAVAALRAVTDAPQIFAKGCASVDAHQQHLLETAQRLRVVLQQAANALDYEDDVQYRNGMAAFKLSDGSVHVGGGRADVDAVERLLNYRLSQP